MSLSWIYLGHIVESWVNYKNEHVALVDLEALGRWNLAFFEKKNRKMSSKLCAIVARRR